MKRALVLATLGVALQASVGFGADAGLLARVQQADGWVEWTVPMVADAGDMCCYSDKHGSMRGECDLDGRYGGFGTSDDSPLPHSGMLSVYAHVSHAHIDDVRAYGASCVVRSNTSIRRVDNVDPAVSVRLLTDWMDDGDRGKSRDDVALAAIAYHADASATTLLAARAEPANPTEQRENALFWLGEARGADGAAIVERYATTDGDPKLREHAIFALSQSHAGDSYARIQAISASDPADHVRSQALFWMAQMHDQRAATDIAAALRADASDAVREQAVFALSQLGGTKADDALIALMRGDYPRNVKKQALFWLGQSGSARAIEFFDQTLSRSATAKGT